MAGTPTKNEVHIDKPLTNISLAFMNDANAFVARKVAPWIPVDKQTDKYFEFDKSAFFKDRMMKRGDSEESMGSGYTISNSSYACDVYALHKKIGDQVRANVDDPLDPDREAAMFLAHNALIRLEQDFIDTAFAAASWTSGATPTNQWSDYTASDPISDVDDQKQNILSLTGKAEGIKMVMPYQVFKILRKHPVIIDRIKYTSDRSVTPALLANLFEIDEVLVPYALSDSNSEGVTGASLAFMYGKHCLLVHVPKSPGIMTPSGLYTFGWRGLNNEYGNGGFSVRKYREDRRKCDVVEIEGAFDIKVVSADCGSFMPSVVA